MNPCLNKTSNTTDKSLETCVSWECGC